MGGFAHNSPILVLGAAGGRGAHVRRHHRGWHSADRALGMGSWICGAFGGLVGQLGALGTVFFFGVRRVGL